MNEKSSLKRVVIDTGSLPDKYPTHRHSSEFWEALGRTVATYGFLEEILGKAIFVFTATREYQEDEVKEALENWSRTLERALYDPLGNLIDSYSKSVRENSNSTIENLDDLVEKLRKASKVRNVLCHGSWRYPDVDGKSVPFFINRQNEIFDTPVDVLYLEKVQRHVSELACAVVNSVTHMGWKFPGSNGPGKLII